MQIVKPRHRFDFNTGEKPMELPYVRPTGFFEEGDEFSGRRMTLNRQWIKKRELHTVLEIHDKRSHTYKFNGTKI